MEDQTRKSFDRNSFGRSRAAGDCQRSRRVQPHADDWRPGKGAPDRGVDGSCIREKVRKRDSIRSSEVRLYYELNLS